MAIQFESSIDVDGRGIIGSGNTIGTINASIIGANNNATTLSTVDSNTNTIIGDSNSGRYGNTVITDRTLRIGRADNIGASTANTTGILNFNDSVYANAAYSNVGGIIGYFPPPTTTNNYNFFTALSENVDGNVFSAGASPTASRITISTDPNLDNIGYKFDSNTSNGGGVYYTVSQNNASASSRGIVTFDCRHQNQNSNVPDGHSLFEVTAGYGNTKFLIKQVSGSTNVGIGTTNPLTKLQVGNGTADDAVRSYFNDGSYTEMRGYGLQFSRAASYIRPTADNTKTLYLGSSTAQWNALSIDASTTTFNVNGSEKMRIDSNGNVGIGETNPDTLLHITGDEPTIKLEDNVTPNYFNPKIEFFGSSEGGTLEYLSNPGFAGMRLHYRNTALNQDTFLELKNGQAAFTSANITGGTNVSMTGELQVFGGDTSYFSAGNLAIGATSATERLYVAGNTSVSNNVYIGSGNTLKACTYSAQYSLVVGQSNTLGGISNGIIGVSNTIECTNEPWLSFGGNFIAGINNTINNLYSHANAVFGQSNAVGDPTTASNSVAGILVSGASHSTFGSNSVAFGESCFTDISAQRSLTGGFDCNNFGYYGSVAIGSGATASTGNNQYAFGTGVTTPTTVSAAYGADQFVVGKFNEYTNASSVPHRFAVGNGSSDASRDTPFCIIGSGTYTNGQVSINDADGYAYTSVPYSIFHVNGRATSSYSSTFTTTSDERVKKNIVDYSKGLAEIIQVQPKSYAFNGKGNTIEDVESIGVLAQEIKEVFPETVGTVNKRLNPEDEQETELYTVDISPVTYALINAVKELNAKVQALEARIQTLEGN